MGVHACISSVIRALLLNIYRNEECFTQKFYLKWNMQMPSTLFPEVMRISVALNRIFPFCRVSPHTSRAIEEIVIIFHWKQFCSAAFNLVSGLKSLTDF